MVVRAYMRLSSKRYRNAKARTHELEKQVEADAESSPFRFADVRVGLTSAPPRALRCGREQAAA
jgi:hypothetical protein